MKSIRRFFAGVKEGFSGLWQHRSMGFASVLSMFLTLVILAFVLITVLNLNQAVVDVKDKVNEIEIFVEDSVAGPKIEEMKNHLESQAGVLSVTYKSKEEALANFQETLGEDGYLVEGMQEALPQSFVVEMGDIEQTDTFVRNIQSLEGVSEIRYYQDLVDRIVTISTYVQYAGAAVVILLILISIITIFNTIKLTVFARSKEIQIKKYIGASNPMITSPFIIEGIVFGLIGSALAFVIVYLLYNYLFENYSRAVFNLISSYLIDPAMIMTNILIILITLGVGIGALGSIFSVRKHLEV